MSIVTMSENQVVEFVLRDVYWRTIDRELDDDDWNDLFDVAIRDLFEAGVSLETLRWMSVQYIKDEFANWNNK